jgi:hypothetical protein
MVDFGGGKKHQSSNEWMMCPPMTFFLNTWHLPNSSFWPWIPMDIIAHNAAISNSAKQLRWQLALQHWDEIVRRRDQRTFRNQSYGRIYPIGMGEIGV